MNTQPPDDFPRFHVPGFETEMDALRRLFWRHMITDGMDIEAWMKCPAYPELPFGRTGPLWDNWLSLSHLWLAVETGALHQRLRENWAASLSRQLIDAEGYVATIQNPAYTHNHGWPFPGWRDGWGGTGWHFSFADTAGIRPELAFRPPGPVTEAGWSLTGAESQGITELGWQVVFSAAAACLESPACQIDPEQAPFLQIRWRADLPDDCQPRLAWATEDRPEFDTDRQIEFETPVGGGMHWTMIPLYRHAEWQGTITRLRILLDPVNPGEGATITAVFTHYDTRHNVNNPNFVQGCLRYFHWTHDLNFLRHNLSRMRQALAYCLTEFHAEQEKMVVTRWPGHDGVSGFTLRENGSVDLNYGHGIGNNYDDIVPCGFRDTYATIQLYGAVTGMAQLEDALGRHPEWEIPSEISPYSMDLHRLAAEISTTTNEAFWDGEKGRFVACVDVQGQPHDHGYTLLNLEAITSGLATSEHARQIMDWIAGERMIDGDTSQGADIYRWRFAPRWSTLKNTDYWVWFSEAMRLSPFGESVLDGGAILGFSYYDVLARLMVRGAEDAWERLQEIARWSGEVEAAGGYLAYYQTHDGNLQGAGYGGALGLHLEFFESVMVPSVLLYGFMGFSPTLDGFKISPQLPAAWPSLGIDRIAWRDMILSMVADRNSIQIQKSAGEASLCCIQLPENDWKVAGPVESRGAVQSVSSSAGWTEVVVDWRDLQRLVLVRQPPS